MLWQVAAVAVAVCAAELTDERLADAPNDGPADDEGAPAEGYSETEPETQLLAAVVSAGLGDVSFVYPSSVCHLLLASLNEDLFAAMPFTSAIRVAIKLTCRVSSHETTAPAKHADRLQCNQLDYQCTGSTDKGTPSRMHITGPCTPNDTRVCASIIEFVVLLNTSLDSDSYRQVFRFSALENTAFRRAYPWPTFTTSAPGVVGATQAPGPNPAATPQPGPRPSSSPATSSPPAPGMNAGGDANNNNNNNASPIALWLGIAGIGGVLVLGGLLIIRVTNRSMRYKETVEVVREGDDGVAACAWKATTRVFMAGDGFKAANFPMSAGYMDNPPRRRDDTSTTDDEASWDDKQEHELAVPVPSPGPRSAGGILALEENVLTASAGPLGAEFLQAIRAYGGDKRGPSVFPPMSMRYAAALRDSYESGKSHRTGKSSVTTSRSAAGSASFGKQSEEDDNSSTNECALSLAHNPLHMQYASSITPESLALLRSAVASSGTSTADLSVDMLLSYAVQLIYTQQSPHQQYSCPNCTTRLPVSPRFCRCRGIAYCSEICRRQNWNTHSTDCAAKMADQQ